MELVQQGALLPSTHFRMTFAAIQPSTQTSTSPGFTQIQSKSALNFRIFNLHFLVEEAELLDAVST